MKVCTLIYYLSVIVLFSCNNDFLEKYPLDQVSNKTFWNAENDFIAFSNHLHSLTADTRGLVGINLPRANYCGRDWYDVYSPMFAPISPTIKHHIDVNAGQHQIPEVPEVHGYGGWDFVRAVNIGIENILTSDVQQGIINKYVGEARFMRGWFYAVKVSRFGDITWVDNELSVNSKELYQARTPREEVMDNVLVDLNFAIDNLPSDWGDGNNPGRFDRWDALHIKSRVCLFEGTWRKYHGGSNSNMWLQEAVDAAKILIEEGPYSLYVTGDFKNDYNAYHRMVNIDGNTEVLHYQKYQLPYKFNDNIDFIYRRADPGGVTKSMIEDYLCEDGLPISLSPLYQGDEVYEEIFENRDPRLRQSILHPEDQEFYGFDPISGGPNIKIPRLLGMQDGVLTTTGYQPIKTYNAEEAGSQWNTRTQPSINMRLGETLLNYAEAKAELATLTQHDLDISINLLRDRVGMPHMDLNDIPIDPRYDNEGISPLLVEIRRERKVELFMEGFYYDDLRRWKRGDKMKIKRLGMRWDKANRERFDPNGEVTLQTSIVNGIEYIDPYKGTGYETPIFDEGKDYLWPIPLSELSKNPELGQNPGWGK